MGVFWSGARDRRAYISFSVAALPVSYFLQRSVADIVGCHHLSIFSMMSAFFFSSRSNSEHFPCITLVRPSVACCDVTSQITSQ